MSTIFNNTAALAGGATALLTPGRITQTTISAPLGSSAAVTGAGGGATTSSSTAASNISSNDFLTLLVSELQNQDPTQPTDPNAYVQQLVSVNSLQQLIQINQDLTPSGTTSSTGASARQTAAI